jgi:hypothetical protein
LRFALSASGYGSYCCEPCTGALLNDFRRSSNAALLGWWFGFFGTLSFLPCNWRKDKDWSSVAMLIFRVRINLNQSQDQTDCGFRLATTFRSFRRWCVRLGREKRLSGIHNPGRGVWIPGSRPWRVEDARKRAYARAPE